MPVTNAEHIRNLKATIDQKEVEKAAILSAARDAGETLTDDQRDEIKGLNTDITSLKGDLELYEEMEDTNKSLATEVTADPANRQKSASVARGGHAPAIHLNKIPEEAFPGQFFVQRTIAKAIAKIDGVSASGYAYQRFVKNAYRGRQNPMLVDIIKANEVAAGAETSGEWGAELVQADGRFTGDFIDYLRGQTVFDQLPLREVPANVTIKGRDGVSTAYWTGEGLAAKATAGNYSAVTLTPLKVTALAAVNKELLRDATPSAEMLVRDDLVQAISTLVDTTFLSTSAAVSGVSPAGMLNGLSAITSAGTTADDVGYDINALYADFMTAKNAQNLQIIMQPALAKSISLLRTTLGAYEFPGLNANGGTLLGDPVKVSDNLSSGYMMLLKPSDIYRIGDMGIQVSVSDQATLEMSTAPQGDNLTPTAASANLQSMFQEDAVAFKVVRPLNWAKRRSTAVTYASGCAYAPTSS